MADIETINDKIITNYDKDQKKAIRSITKNGFVNVDGKFMQYNPKLNEFVPITNEYILKVLFNSMGNNWGFVSSNELIEVLKNDLPNITAKDIEDFKLYVQWVNIQIDNDLIQELLDKAIKDNNSFKSNNDLKGKYDLITQMMVLRNNDVFSNGNYLFKFKDDNFKIIKSNDVRDLLNDTIVVNDDNIQLQLIKNNYKSYLNNLTDIKELLELIRKRDEKARILSNTEQGFKEVMKIINKY